MVLFDWLSPLPPLDDYGTIIICLSGMIPACCKDGALLAYWQ